MKVLYLIDSLEGYGAEKSIVQIAVNMEAVTPVFVHLYSGDKLKTTLLNAGIKVYSPNINSKYGYNQATALISSIIQKEKPKIIHSTLFRADTVSRKLKRSFPDLLLVGSFVSNSYGKKRYDHLSVLSKIKLFSTQWRDLISASKVDFFISNSKSIMKTNTKALKIPKNKVKVIYRGRSFKDFSPSLEAVNALRERFSLGKNKVFLNVGRLIKSKGQLDLLKAFKKVIEGYPNSRLLIVGEGSFRPKLQEEIKNLDLQQKVFLLGYREDIADLLAVSDFFVFPSYFEGLPGALIEAIIAQKPCIISDIPENRECFPQNGALYFPPGDIEALSSKMEEAMVLKDWEERLKISFEHAERNFEIGNISKAYEIFYKKILTKKQLQELT